jgi:hypothetical protein
MTYGCRNKPRPVANMPLDVQSGWTDENVMVNNCHREEATRLPYMIRVPFVMTTACQYTKQHATDPGCAGCEHQSKKDPS